MAMAQPKKRAAEPSAIPDRLYFKIGDVARICGVETYVLRFWETQFPQLKPNKSGTGQRLYRRSDVELALRIKQLVHVEGFTLAGARQALEQVNRAPGLFVEAQAVAAAPAQTPEPVAAVIQRACAELRKIAEILAADEAQPARLVSHPIRKNKDAARVGRPATSGTLFPL